MQNVHHEELVPNKKKKSDDTVDKHAKGANFIRIGSDQFNLVFNIMLGIKRSIDCVFESPYY
jgi:hypothetical protein